MKTWPTHRPTKKFIAPGFDDDRVTGVFIAAALFSLAMFLATTPAWIMDTRTLDGVSVWLKPQKFHVSLFVHFVTLAILAQQLPRRVRQGPTLVIFAYAALAACLFEVLYIAIQAARARRSHFNFDTNIEAGLYALMGLGALLLVFVSMALAIQIARKSDRPGSGYKLGSVLGLLVGSVITIGFAGLMSMSGSHWVGVHPAGGETVPFFGWSLETGDRRPAHFVALHMMQTLPLAGWLLDRANGPSRVVVSLLAALQVTTAVALFLQANAGAPLWPLL